MSDTPKEERSKKDESSKSSPSSRVFRYMAILFAAAFILLLLAYFMQQRTIQETQKAHQETISDLTESMTSIHSLQNLVDVNAALQEENAALQLALEEAKATAEQNKEALSLAKQRLEALHTLNNIRALYNQGKYQEARDLVAQHTLLEYYLEEYSQNALSEEGREIYDPLEAYRTLVDWLN